jgi:hypothetical protein
MRITQALPAALTFVLEPILEKCTQIAAKSGSLPCQKKLSVFPSNVIVITDAVWIVLASCEVGVNGRKALLPAIPTLSQMMLPESKCSCPRKGEKL